MMNLTKKKNRMERSITSVNQKQRKTHVNKQKSKTCRYVSEKNRARFCLLLTERSEVSDLGRPFCQCRFNDYGHTPFYPTEV